MSQERNTPSSHEQLSASLKEAEEREKQLRDLLEVAPEAIFGVNHRGIIVFANSQSEILFGYTRDELVGSSVDLLLPESMREPHRHHREAYDNSPRTRRMGSGLDLLALRKDGRTFPVEISLSPLATADGGLTIAIIRDVTEQKKLEEQLRQNAEDLERKVEERTQELRNERDFSQQIIEHANSLVIALAMDGIILLFNLEVEKITGFTSNEMVGRNWTERLLPETARSQADWLLGAVKSDQIPDHWECAVQSKDGTTHDVIWHISALRDEKHRVISVVAVGRNLSEERRLQERIIHSERLATVGRMAAQVAHEIRNPLSAIGLNIELLGDEFKDHQWPDTTEASDLIRITLSEIERLNGVIRDYLQFARMPVKQLQENSLNDVVGDLVQLLRPEIEAAHVTLVVNVSPDLPAVRLDRTLLSQAILNCIRNALEAMPQGGTLTLMTEEMDSVVSIGIRDTGIGIVEEHLDRIFDPFFSTKDYGTGLGLPYVRQIVQEHQGWADIDSSTEAGTTITLSFPVFTEGKR